MGEPQRGTGWRRQRRARRLVHGRAGRLRAEVAPVVASEILDRTPKPIIVLDLDLTIRFANQRAVELFGHTRSELCTSSVELLMAEGSARFRAALASRCDEGAIRLTFLARRKDRSEFPLDALMRYMPDRELVVLVGREPDATESVRLENALFEVRKEALTAMQRRTSFLARMSHEIRTPMNGVLGLLELALDSELTAEHREQLALARKLGRGLVTLLDDILDFSQIDAGKLRLEQVHFSLRDEIGIAVQALAPAAHEKGLELVIHIPAEVPDLVIGDPKRIAQIVSNLVSNAVKFTEHGAILVGVALEGVVEDTRPVTITIAVTDNGVGIAQESLATIFDPFTQAEVASDSHRAGVGLGLAICRELAELMGGRLSAQSQLGRGSQFSLTLALETGAPHRPPAPSSERLRGLRVLAVVDHHTTRDVLLGIMNASKLAVTTAHSSTVEAIAAAGGKFDVLLVDFDLESAECVAVVDRLREAHPGTPLILLVPARRQDASGKLDAMKARATLAKPILASSFLSVIDAVVEPARPSPSEVAGGGVAAPSDSISILVAEDYAPNRYVQRTLLERAGHSVTVVENGREALVALRDHRFDVVLMDVQMPEMDGLTATREIRAREAVTGGRIPIVALTAQATDGDREECLAAGMDAYISKPIDAERLFATLERLTLRKPGTWQRRLRDSRGRRKATPRPFIVGADTSDETLSPSRTYDRWTLKHRLGGNEDLVRDVETLFLNGLEDLVLEVADAITTSDVRGVRASAHKLSGALSNVSATRVLEIARMMEEAARAGDIATPRTLLEPLRLGASELAAHIRQSLSAHRSQ